MHDWVGNALSNDGIEIQVGGVRAHLVRATRPQEIKVLSSDVARKWKRSWVLTIYRGGSMFQIGTQILVSVHLLDMMADQARREAEIILAWAEAFYRETEEYVLSEERTPPCPD